jgi:hypothetical protein
MNTKFERTLYRKLITEMNENIMRQMGFNKEMDNVKNNICPCCNAPVNQDEFKDELSKKEFKISGLCQKCQDEVFGGEEEDFEENEYMDTYNKYADEAELEDSYDRELPEEPEDFRDDEYVNPAVDAQDDQDDLIE